MSRYPYDESANFVKGNMTRIQPGLCFSDKPTIASFGEFGIRHELPVRHVCRRQAVYAAASAVSSARASPFP